ACRRRRASRSARRRSSSAGAASPASSPPAARSSPCLPRPNCPSSTTTASASSRRSHKMDYAHARHAGNAGDVFKHVALLAVLDELLRDPAPLEYVETHAGDGLYPLGSVGEWSDGIG